MEVIPDIVIEIFSWLPAKSICKLKSTCKSFSKFLEETTFITKHAHNSLERDDTYFFIQPEKIKQKYERRVEIHSLSKEQQFSGVPDNVLTYLSNKACVLDSCNGLILCQAINEDEGLDLFVCNPITKSWSSIPNPESLTIDHKFSNINFMLNCSCGSSDDYLVFLFENTSEWSPTYVCNVYHGNNGVWKTMKKCFSSGGGNLKFNKPVFYNGAIHFILDTNFYVGRWSPFYKPYIMSYNLEDGTSTMLKLPTQGDVKYFQHVCNMGIFNWGKVSSSNRSICLLKLTKFVLTVWVLEDYESSSWQEVLNMTVEELGLKETDIDVTEFTVMNGNLLVFATGKKIYSCELDNKRFRKVEEICQHNCGSNPRLISYSDTLRSCGSKARTMPC